MSRKSLLRSIGGVLIVLSIAVAGCTQATPAAPTTGAPAVATQAMPATEAPTSAPASSQPEAQPTSVEQAASPGESQPARGGTVVLIIPEEPAMLNYYLTDASIVQQVADATSTTGLTTVDENGDYVPVLATGLPTAKNGGLSDDFLTVTWKLLPDLKWSDGQPLTSDDVKFTWEAISNPNGGAMITEGFSSIDSIETPDPLTAVVHYTEPYAGYLGQFAHGILPRHASGTPETMADWEWNRNPVVAGPFVVSEWNSGDSIVMVPNPYYFEAGKPYLDQLIFKVVPEPAAQTALMMSGEAQVHLWPGEGEEEYNNLLAGKGKVVLVPGIWNMAIDFNLSKPFDKDPGSTPPHPILGDIRVRQAIAHAIDYDTLVKTIPNVDPSTTPFAYGWYKCDVPRQFAFDPEAARQLLDEAGWVVGSDGIRVAQGAQYAEDGTRLSLELQGYTNFEPLQRTEEFIVENLKAVGVEARIQNYDFSIIFGSYADGSPRKLGDFDMLIYDRGTNIEPHGYIANHYSSTQIPSADNTAGGNVFRWINSDADAAIQAAGSTLDIDARKEAYCKLAEQISNDLPQIFLYLFKDGYGFSNRLNGYTVSTWGSMTWGSQNWYLTQ